MRLELSREVFIVKLVYHYTTQGAWEFTIIDIIKWSVQNIWIAKTVYFSFFFSSILIYFKTVLKSFSNH